MFSVLVLADSADSIPILYHTEQGSNLLCLKRIGTPLRHPCPRPRSRIIKLPSFFGGFPGGVSVFEPYKFLGWVCVSKFGRPAASPVVICVLAHGNVPMFIIVYDHTLVPVLIIDRPISSGRVPSSTWWVYVYDSSTRNLTHLFVNIIL